MATAFTSGFRWEVKQMLEIIANGSNTYPYQKSTLSDLYRLLETYTLDPVFERYGEFVNRTPCCSPLTGRRCALSIYG